MPALGITRRYGRARTTPILQNEIIYMNPNPTGGTGGSGANDWTTIDGGTITITRAMLKNSAYTISGMIISYVYQDSTGIGLTRILVNGEAYPQANNLNTLASTVAWYIPVTNPNKPVVIQIQDKSSAAHTMMYSLVEITAIFTQVV